MKKIDFAILKLSFQIYVILSSALRTNFEILGRQFVCQFSNTISDLVCFSPTVISRQTLETALQNLLFGMPYGQILKLNYEPGTN